MPIDLVVIDRVDACATAKPGCHSYTVTATTIEDRPRTVQYQTVNAWYASFCKQSIATKRELWITWNGNSFKSKELTKAEPDTSAWRPMPRGA
jgi:hypothetical protein